MMKRVVFFERKLDVNNISIEKVFDSLYKEFSKNVNNNLHFQRIKNPYSFSFLNIIRSIFYFKNLQGDINHITGDIHWLGIFLNKDKTILTIHDMAAVNSLKGLRRTIYKLFWFYLPIKKLKYITAISEKTRDEIIRIYPQFKKKIRVVPNCVTMDGLEISELKNKDYSKYLIVGTRFNKNIERCILALKGHSSELIIIGSLNKNQIYLLNKNKVNYTNYENLTEDDLIRVYDSAGVLLFPSLYEGFGLPILEAQRRGLLVITSNISPLKEVAGEGAVLVDPYSIEDIKTAISFVDNLSKESRDRLIELNYENLKSYDGEFISNQYVNIYKEIL